jgi:hypothetical protein
MKYELSEAYVRQVKKNIPVIKQKIEMWENEREKAFVDRKKQPAKYYNNITERIKYSEKQIIKYAQLLKEMEDICLNKNIQI